MHLVTSIGQMYGNTWDGTKIMVFGLEKCGYEAVAHDLSVQQIKVYKYEIGIDDPEDPTPRSDGIVQIKSEAKTSQFVTQRIARSCKSALVNIIFLNYVRVEQTLQIVPIIFCIEWKGKKLTFKEMTVTKIYGQRTKVVTASEIRRAYKLCTDLTLPDRLRDVANATFQFVRVIGSKYCPSGLEPIAAPWNDPAVRLSFDGRALARDAAGRAVGQSNWRKQLIDLIEKYDREGLY